MLLLQSSWMSWAKVRSCSGWGPITQGYKCWTYKETMMILHFHWSGTSGGCGLEDPGSWASLPPCPKSPGHWSYGSSETRQINNICCLDHDDDDNDDDGDQFRVPRPPWEHPCQARWAPCPICVCRAEWVLRCERSVERINLSHHSGQTP